MEASQIFHFHIKLYFGGQGGGDNQKPAWSKVSFRGSFIEKIKPELFSSSKLGEASRFLYLSNFFIPWKLFVSTLSLY
jgi:hypothetical protein